MTDREIRCVGDDLDRTAVAPCDKDPEFVVAGDGACRYHVGRVIRARAEETGRATVDVEWLLWEPRP